MINVKSSLNIIKKKLNWVRVASYSLVVFLNFGFLRFLSKGGKTLHIRFYVLMLSSFIF